MIAAVGIQSVGRSPRAVHAYRAA